MAFEKTYQEQAMNPLDSLTAEEVVARIQSTPPNPGAVRRPSADLGRLLESSPLEPSFDLNAWQRQWAAVEAELKAITDANNVAEGRG
jgi:hypothetical protein